MKMIERELYLEKLKKFQRTPLIKVITGMRRAGKSTLLELFALELKKQGVTDEQIIRINFESMAFDDINNYRQLYTYIKEHQKADYTYLFLDEIQQVEYWEKAINSLFAEGYWLGVMWKYRYFLFHLMSICYFYHLKSGGIKQRPLNLI